jgi:hypothetical protein
MSDWSSVYIDQIEDCEKRESKMTEWEKNFIASLREWIEADKRPTQKQVDTLDRIWEKATARG